MTSNKPRITVTPLTARIEEHEAGIRRLDLAFFSTKGVPKGANAAVRKGIKKIISDIGSKIRTFDLSDFQGNGVPLSPEWIKRHSLMSRDVGHGDQVDYRKVREYLSQVSDKKERGGRPIFGVLTVNHDMTDGNDPDIDHIYGAGIYPNVVLSVRRVLDGIKGDTEREATIAMLAAHEFGHVYGLVRRNINAGTSGLRKIHCNGEKGPCLMEQIEIAGARSPLEQAQVVTFRNDELSYAHNWLCSDCTQEMRAITTDLTRRGVDW